MKVKIDITTIHEGVWISGELEDTVSETLPCFFCNSVTRTICTPLNVQLRILPGSVSYNETGKGGMSSVWPTCIARENDCARNGGAARSCFRVSSSVPHIPILKFAPGNSLWHRYLRYLPFVDVVQHLLKTAGRSCP